MRKAHRIAYESANGPIPDGQQIRHMCHNPSCVNPEHLKAGTQTDNSRDMVAVGNQRHQKLRKDEVSEIRRIFAEGGVSYAQLASQYGVTSGNIGLIIRNKTFPDEAHTPPPPATGRPRGSLLSRINEDSAKEIRRLYLAGGVSQRALAEEFQVNGAIISAVVGNRLYPAPDYTRPVRRNHNQKLTEEQVEAIREKTVVGVPPKQLAEEFGVTQGLINQIIAGKIHNGEARQYSRKPQEIAELRPTLRSLNGPAPTSIPEQQRRLVESRTRSARRPLRKPGDPLITENDWVRDPKTGCHDWRWGTKARGSITVDNGRRKLAYHVAWEMAHEPIPEGSQINHKCNNGRCINVDHLYLGDQFDNMRDVAKDGYHAHANRKLTWEQVRAIRDEYQPGKITYKQLGYKYNVTAAEISNIINNKTYYASDYTPKNPGVNVNRRLSMDVANELRRRFRNERVTQSALAREYDVSLPVVSRIIRNEYYVVPNYIPPPPNATRRWKLSDDDIAWAHSQFTAHPHADTIRACAKKLGVNPAHLSRILRRRFPS